MLGRRVPVLVLVLLLVLVPVLVPTATKTITVAIPFTQASLTPNANQLHQLLGRRDGQRPRGQSRLVFSRPHDGRSLTRRVPVEAPLFLRDALVRGLTLQRNLLHL